MVFQQPSKFAFSKIVKGAQAINWISEGATHLAKAVQLTLGPGGRNAVIDPFEQSNFNALSIYPLPIITKDGVTVAKAINYLSDPEHPERGRLQNIGAKLLIDAASRTNEESGDGTTSCTIIARTMLSEGVKYRQFCNDPVQVRQGIKFAVHQVCKQLDDNSRKITDSLQVNQIAMVSSNFDPKIAAIIEQIYVSDPHGLTAVSIGSGDSLYSLVPTLEHQKGYSIESGFLSPYFAKNGEANYDNNCYVFLSDSVIEDQQELLPLMEFAAKVRKAVVVVAPDFRADALTSMVINHLNGKCTLCAVKTPMVDQQGVLSVLEDIAAYTGATVVSKDLGQQLRFVDPVTVVGKTNAVQISRGRTILLGGQGANVSQRVSFLQNFVNESEIGDYDTDLVNERISKLQGGLMLIQPGGSSKMEMSECRDRIEDAVCAVKAALQEGYLPGSGSALLHASQAIETQSTQTSYLFGVNLVKKACEAPFRQLIFNKCNREPGIILEQVLRDKRFGFDANSEQVHDMFAAGIIDPTKVVKNSLIYGCSVASMILTSDCAVLHHDDQILIEHDDMNL